MKPLPKVIKTRNRFVKLNESQDRSLLIENPSMSSIDNVKSILESTPHYDNEIKYGKCKYFNSFAMK